MHKEQDPPKSVQRHIPEWERRIAGLTHDLQLIPLLVSLDAFRTYVQDDVTGWPVQAMVHAADVRGKRDCYDVDQLLAALLQAREFVQIVGDDEGANLKRMNNRLI